MSQATAPWQEDFLHRHGLERDYLLHAQKWFDPLAEVLSLHHRGANGPLLLALNGSQGSGKTTLGAYLCARLEAEQGLRVLSLSLDDFYLTRAQRDALAASVHPLLGTRGVPGTHDMALLAVTLDALLAATPTGGVPVPRFDKAEDDRRPRELWDQFEGRPDLILLEGWCLGARPQTAEALQLPVNALERDEDPDGSWRAYVNGALARDFLPLYQRVDCWVMLQAPSFDCVYRWRLEQEHKLANSAPRDSQGVMSDDQVARFIQFYQRLTQDCLARLPECVDFLYTLDSRRNITSFRQGREVVA